MSVTPTASKQVSLETQGILELMLLSEEGNDKVSDQLLRTNKTITVFMAQVSEQLKTLSEENLLLKKKFIELESQHAQERSVDRAMNESLQLANQAILKELTNIKTTFESSITKLHRRTDGLAEHFYTFQYDSTHPAIPPKGMAMWFCATADASIDILIAERLAAIKQQVNQNKSL